MSGEPAEVHVVTTEETEEGITLAIIQAAEDLPSEQQTAFKVGFVTETMVYREINYAT